MADVQIMDRYCYFCMNPLNETQHKCPVCRHDRNEKVDAHGHLPRCILNNQYLVGKKLGNGGFGITYIGRDLFLDRIVAIKEYFPNSLAYRGADGMTVAAYNDSEGQKEQFEHGKQRTISEARTVVRMSDLPHVVQMYNAFLANGTAYIVMEYITGETLASCIAREGKPMKWQRAASLLLPLLADLQQMHDKNFIHRDISPDNIMIRKSTNQAVLLDFGAARDFQSEYTVAAGTCRDGYTPIEQYSEELIGQDGRTDEYSFCATMYFALTGKKPVNSQYRAFKDEIVPPRKLGSDIDAAREAVLMQGFAVYKEHRYPSVTMLAQALQNPESAQPVQSPPVKQDIQSKPVSVQTPEKKSSVKTLLAILAAMLVVVVGLVVYGLLSSPETVNVFGREIAVSSLVDTDNQFVISGEVAADSGSISLITIEIFRGDQRVDFRQVRPGAASYQLKDSQMSALVEQMISQLPDGEYRCSISATAESGEIRATCVMYEQAFEVKRASAEQMEVVQTPVKTSPTPTPEPTPGPQKAELSYTSEFEAVPLAHQQYLHVGDTIRFGRFEQDGNKQNSEEIEWYVLDIQDGKALLLSRYVLGSARYTTVKGQSARWEDSEVKKWLDEEFSTAFKPDEMQAISGADRFVLLTREQAEKYLSDASQRIVQRTEAVTEWTGKECPWLLMSDGEVDYVTEKGQFTAAKKDNIVRAGVRPAVWIDISAAGYDTAQPLNSSARVGDRVSFGSYMYELDAGRRDMEWLVISIEGNCAKLLSVNLVEAQQYHNDRGANVSWKDCSLRSWLNNDFVRIAFSQVQQSALMAAVLEDGVTDRVYLLSRNELEALFPEQEDRVPGLTPYSEVSVRLPAYWWLRSTEGASDHAPVVKDDGALREKGAFVDESVNGVRPVICVDLNALNN